MRPMRPVDVAPPREVEPQTRETVFDIHGLRASYGSNVAIKDVDLEISRNLPPDTSALIRFTAPKPGRYRFYCKYHQQEMQGWLTVR